MEFFFLFNKFNVCVNFYCRLIFINILIKHNWTNDLYYDIKYLDLYLSLKFFQFYFYLSLMTFLIYLQNSL